MQKVSVRTLTLMLLLLASVLAHQYVRFVPAARADAVWLAVGDPNDPNEGPIPECAFQGGRTALDDDPNEPTEPIPEMAGFSRGFFHLDGDPNEPTEPMPERA